MLCHKRCVFSFSWQSSEYTSDSLSNLVFQTYAEVIEALNEAANNDDIKVAVLTGKFPKKCKMSKAKLNDKPWRAPNALDCNRMIAHFPMH